MNWFDKLLPPKIKSGAQRKTVIAGCGSPAVTKDTSALRPRFFNDSNVCSMRDIRPRSLSKLDRYPTAGSDGMNILVPAPGKIDHDDGWARNSSTMRKTSRRVT